MIMQSLEDTKNKMEIMLIILAVVCSVFLILNTSKVIAGKKVNYKLLICLIISMILFILYMWWKI